MKLYKLEKITPEYTEYFRLTVLGESEEEVRKYAYDYVLNHILFMDGWGKSVDREVPQDIQDKAEKEAIKWLDKDKTRCKECRFEKGKGDWIIKKEVIFER